MTRDEAPKTLDDLRAMPAPVVTINDTSELLGIDSRTVRRACERGELPAIKVGRRTLVLRDALIARLEGRAS